jgi:hypothetical protein
MRLQKEIEVKKKSLIFLSLREELKFMLLKFSELNFILKTKLTSNSRAISSSTSFFDARILLVILILRPFCYSIQTAVEIFFLSSTSAVRMFLVIS